MVAGETHKDEAISDDDGRHEEGKAIEVRLGGEAAVESVVRSDLFGKKR